MNASSLEAWMKESKAPALDHTLELFHEIKNRGFKIFLVSSRKETLRSPTVDNLIKVGYHGWTTLKLRYYLLLNYCLLVATFISFIYSCKFVLINEYNCRGLDDELMEVKKYQSKVRQQLVDQGYRIWGIVGDQWSSFEGLPTAYRTFKLPNSIYYLA